MRVLFCKTFGIGNAVMAVPAIKALASMGNQVDVLVGRTPDDIGAWEVFTLLRDHLGTVGRVWIDSVSPSEPAYDLAIQSIPYDGRWQNGVHFRAAVVMDGRTRPDPSTVGLVSWKKHEVEYQMDNIYSLGYEGPIPSCEFMQSHQVDGDHCFYLGVGYKKDSAGFWKKKHWGNENYAALVKMILADHPSNRVYVTGDSGDVGMSIRPIMRAVDSDNFILLPRQLKHSFDVVNDCGTYVGNDTGMMHVAAARGRKVVALFFLENSITKSRPWCDDSRVIDGFNRIVSPEEVFQRIKEQA